ncbi:MAG: cobaltochelatase subunit CobN [Eubacteriaceae bacterium]|nr:cobaltochelatase subunit CobN [Eubacteriaceae bacterium]
MTRIVYMAQMSVDAAFFGEFSDELAKRHPQSFSLSYYDASELGQNSDLYNDFLHEALESDLFMVDIHGSLTYVNYFADLMKSLAGKKMFILCGLEQEITELMPDMGISQMQYAYIDSYIRAGGIENYISMACYIANEWCSGSFSVADPVVEKWQFIYEPSGPVADEEAYLSLARDPSKLRVGVIIHENQMKKNDMRVAGSLHDTLVQVGAQPIVLVTNVVPSKHPQTLDFKEALLHYFTEGGKPAVDAIINTMGFSVSVLSQPTDGSGSRVERSIFELTSVPVIQAMHTYYSYEQWLESAAGIDAMMLGVCVYEPEFDGQMTSFPISTLEYEQTPYGPRATSKPIPERMERLCTLARNWARLSKIRPENKKVALILHNSPPRNDTIGCAHQLDTPASIHNMLNEMNRKGIKLDYEFDGGQDVIDRIIAGLTNDGGWMAEEEMLELACSTVSAETYKVWHESFRQEVQDKLQLDWGPPPGEFMAVGDEILIPGIINGNVFIGLQPPRALEEKAEEAYHSTEFVCPHQYLAFYKWIEQIFKADVIVHVGTHGTLEWLPGKEIGLSDACYPDLAIGSIPHLYIYNVAVTGEGMQAKRRSYATLVGHMVPSMADGGTYGELAEMDELIEDYYHARNAAPQNLPVLYGQIWDLALKLNLHQDLEICHRARLAALTAKFFRIIVEHYQRLLGRGHAKRI